MFHGITVLAVYYNPMRITTLYNKYARDKYDARANSLHANVNFFMLMLTHTATTKIMMVMMMLSDVDVMAVPDCPFRIDARWALVLATLPLRAQIAEQAGGRAKVRTLAKPQRKPQLGSSDDTHTTHTHISKKD